MTPSNDPLVSLWQTAAKPDTQHLLHDLQRVRQMHRWLNRTIIAFLGIATALLIVAEAIGHIETHGILSVIWILALGGGVMWRRRTLCNHFDAFDLDTVSLLKRMLARAQSDLVLARRLYAGIPLGALVGAFVMKLVSDGAPPAVSAHPQLRLILTGAGAALLIVMTVTGLILARSRRLQVQELTEKLRSVEAEL